MKYFLFFLLWAGVAHAVTAVDNPLTTDDQHRNIDELFRNAQNRNFRFIRQSSPTLQNTVEDEVFFTRFGTGTIRLWVRENNTLFYSNIFNDTSNDKTAYVVFSGTSTAPADAFILRGKNVASIGHANGGIFAVNFPAGFWSNINYVCTCTSEFDVGTVGTACGQDTDSPASATVWGLRVYKTSDETLYDSRRVFVSCIGN